MATPKFTTAVAGAALLTLLQATGAIDVLGNSPKMLGRIPIGLSTASADTFEGYIPPAGRGRVQRTDGASSRGCTNDSFGSISLLTPSDHVGLTVSARPTFSWYVSAVPATAMQFALVEPGVSKPVLVQRLQVKKSGIVQLDLPQNVPAISVGKAYRWTVSLVCNTKRPSENIYVRSWIVRVANKADRIQQLAITTSERDRATVYARSGIWYDAIAVISKAYLAHPEDRLTAKYFRLLLNQVGLLKSPEL